jgi:hypothetical protein
MYKSRTQGGYQPVEAIIETDVLENSGGVMKNISNKTNSP